MQLRSLSKVEHAVLTAMVAAVSEQLNGEPVEGLGKIIAESGINPYQVAKDLSKELQGSAVFLLSKDKINQENREIEDLLSSIRPEEGFAI